MYFCFTMIQEMMARRLGAEPGEYLHYAGSMHIYEPDLEQVREYVAEGHQKMVEMSPMPAGNPFDLAQALVAAEGRDPRGRALLGLRDDPSLLGQFPPPPASILGLWRRSQARCTQGGHHAGLSDLRRQPSRQAKAPARAARSAVYQGKDGLMWPSWAPEHARLTQALRAHASPMPGLTDPRALDVLAWQIVASLRRENYYRQVQTKSILAKRADPNDPSFDAERAVAYHVRSGRPRRSGMAHFSHDPFRAANRQRLASLARRVRPSRHGSMGLGHG